MEWTRHFEVYINIILKCFIHIEQARWELCLGVANREAHAHCLPRCDVWILPHNNNTHLIKWRLLVSIKDLMGRRIASLSLILPLREPVNVFERI